MAPKALLLSVGGCFFASSVFGWSMFDMYEKSEIHWLPLSVIAWMASIHLLSDAQTALLHHHIKQNREPHVGKTWPVTQAEMKNVKNDITLAIRDLTLAFGIIIFMFGSGSFSKGLISTLIAGFVVARLRHSQ